MLKMVFNWFVTIARDHMFEEYKLDPSIIW